jgi:hypothetical protein
MKQTNRDLLKEAIADAKTVKATALANAKASLEESFTPHLRSMLASKLEEMDREDEEIEEGSEEQLQFEDDNEGFEESGIEEGDDDSIDIEKLMAELEETPINEAEEPEEEKDAEEGDEESEDEAEEEIEGEEDEEIDLEDLSEEDLKNYIEGVIQDMVEKGELEPGEGAEEGEEELGSEDELDLDAEMPGGEEEEVEVPMMERELFELRKELKESLKSLKEAQAEVKETNLLNAKLLYTNKIFREKDLKESQKVKVLKAFDKAKTVREAKIIYESLEVGVVNNTPNKNQRNMSFASKSSAPIRKPLTESIIETDPMVARFRKIAGLD